MQVILQTDVKDLGKIGEVVNVSQGYARNFLFPRSLAQAATETRVKQWEHLKGVSEAKKKKARSDREGMVAKVKEMTLSFKAQAGEGDKLFGSISTYEISKEFEKQGLSVDKKDIVLEDAIKMLGQYKAILDFGDDVKGEFTIIVEKL